jgi:hypothetical protein
VDIFITGCLEIDEPLKRLLPEYFQAIRIE